MLDSNTLSSCFSWHVFSDVITYFLYYNLNPYNGARMSTIKFAIFYENF
jgi:hypothetical protein